MAPRSLDLGSGSQNLDPAAKDLGPVGPDLGDRGQFLGSGLKGADDLCFHTYG